MNPVYHALAALLRLQYGDVLDYSDGGHEGRYKDRVEAAIVLLDGNHVRPVLNNPYRFHVLSQERGEQHRYTVDLGEPHTCQCEDASIRHIPCKHILACFLFFSLQAAFESMPSNTLPVVVNFKDFDKNTISLDARFGYGNWHYVGRANGHYGLPQSPLHNPFLLEQYGREKALQLYKRHLWQHINDESVKRSLGAIKPGDALVCWCAPEPCHGDIVLKAWQYLREQEHQPA